jgi:hypothetical protein
MKKNEEIIRAKLAEVVINFNNQDYFLEYILKTLDSFSYRYFENPLKAEIVSDKIIRVISIEKGIKEAIKIKNPVLRAGISELVKKFSREQVPTILRELRVNLVEKNNNHQGTCHITARISFGHPLHEFISGTYVEELSVLKFEDEIHFRNALAKNLEEVCEIFS